MGELADTSTGRPARAPLTGQRELLAERIGHCSVNLLCGPPGERGNPPELVAHSLQQGRGVVGPLAADIGALRGDLVELDLRLGELDLRLGELASLVACIERQASMPPGQCE